MMNTKLYVGNVAATTTEGDLLILFSIHGNVAEINLRAARESGGLGPFAIVSMATPQGAQAAILGINRKEVAGHALKVTEYVPSRDLPPAAGRNGRMPSTVARRDASASPRLFGAF
jgi:RNA recognition motif-containing protein